MVARLRPLVSRFQQKHTTATGGHKGPPRIHPTALAPTESWMRVLG